MELNDNLLGIDSYELYELTESNIAIINAWRADHLFPYSTLSENEKRDLNRFLLLEVSFTGTHGDSDLFDQLFDNLNQFIEKIVSSVGKQCFFF